MPTLAELRRRFSVPSTGTERSWTGEEMLVTDVRNQVTPKQIVEQKLGAALRRSRELPGQNTESVQ